MQDAPINCNWINLAKDKVLPLSVHMSYDVTLVEKCNFLNLITLMKEVLRIWASRPAGRIQIFNLIALSKMVYISKFCSTKFEPPAESPEQMQSQCNYGSFLAKSHLHGMILLTMLAQNRPKCKRQCFNRAIFYFKIKQGEATGICLRSRGKC